MATTSPMSTDGFPVSATTEQKKKSIMTEIERRNAEILKKIEENSGEKDENEMMGEELEKQITEKASNGMGSAILEMATCPCCAEYYMGNVMQCQNGHSLCETCRDKLPKCPTCKINFGHTKLRNLTMETILTQMNITVQCAYHSLGCTERIPYSKVHDHFRKCKHRPAECFYHCGFKAGTTADYVQHLCDVHRATPTDTPGMEFFELNIGNIASRLSMDSYDRSSNGATFIHQYMDDWLIITLMNMGSNYSYVMTVHSLTKNYYIFSATIQVPDIMYTNQQEFGVRPVDTLEKLYEKKHPHFGEYFKKNMSWFSAELPYNKLMELASYPTSSITCMIRPPSEREMLHFTELETNPNKELMYNPVEESMTQEQINSIINTSEGGQLPSVDFNSPMAEDEIEVSSDEDDEE